MELLRRFEALVVNTHRCAVKELFLAVAETVLVVVERPLVLAFLLLARPVVAVRLVVHFSVFHSFFLFSSRRIEKHLSVLTYNFYLLWRVLPMVGTPNENC